MEDSSLSYNDAALGSLHVENVGNVSNVSELHAASIFRRKLCMVGENLCRYRVLFQQNHRGSMPIVTVGRESCQMAILRIVGYKRSSATGIPMWSPIHVPTRHSVA
jgi:hypothetical protein